METENAVRDDRVGAVDGIEAHQVVAAIPALVDALVASGSPRLYGEVARLVLLAVLRRALEISGGNQLRAARLLGINRNTFRKYCRDLDPIVPRAPRRRTPRLPRAVV